MDNASPSPKKMENPALATQPINQDVMDLVANKGKPKDPSLSDPQVQESIAKLKEIIQRNNIDPQIIIRGGQMADKALLDRNLYPMLVEMAVKEGLISPDKVQQGFDPKLIAGASTAGKLAQMIVDGA